MAVDKDRFGRQRQQAACAGPAGQIVRCTRIGCWYIKSLESRAFPQAFLNHLETPAPYPDSPGLLDWGRARKSVCEQRLS